MIVVIDKLNSRLLLLQREVGLIHITEDLTNEQRCTGLIAVVAFITHLECLSDHNLHIDLAMNLQRFLQHGVIAVAHPMQAVKNLLIAGTKAKHLAKALVHRAVSIIAKRLIDNVPHRHG